MPDWGWRKLLSFFDTRGFLALGAAAGVVVLAACSGSNQGSSTGATAPASATAVSTASALPAGPDRAAVNGKSIFVSWRDTDGVRIAARPPALFPSCAACHLASGAGGLHLPHGAVSADLRRSALVGGQKHPYTIALLERAISTGIDDDGDPLNAVMPHWKMSARDLHDVAAYVLTLH